MKILALDLGKFKTMCCIFDTNTREHEFLTATTDRSYLTTVFKEYKVDLVVMEACGSSGWINDLAGIAWGFTETREVNQTKECWPEFPA